MKFVLVRNVVLSLTICFSGCAMTTDVSREFPYSSMIGDRYIVQDSMGIYRSACWSIGDLVLTPDGSSYSSCFKGEALATVDPGDKFSIKKVILQRFGADGICPQIVVEVDGVNIDGEIFIPLCWSVESISWLDSNRYYFIHRGNPIFLKEEYAVKEL